LPEMKRVLKPDGIILIIGEHAVYLWKGYLKYALKYLTGKLFPKNLQRRIFPEIGDVNKFFLERDEIY
jgi:ubiquinone/menaquinone biosynthesis C-methylase UbiE